MTRAHVRSLSVLVALGGALAMTPAWARPWRVQEIPNGNVNSCYTCHTQNGYWNAFGQDLRTNYGINNGNAPKVPWAQVYDGDSDQDGQTNGQELGDPCGVWTAGCAPQFTSGVSNPGVASSTTSTIPTCSNAGTAPACQSGGGGNGSGGGTNPGTNPGTTSPTGCTAASGPASLSAFALLALAGLVTRRRFGHARRR